MDIIEREYADIHLINRASDVPSGASTVGDLCVIDGLLMICTVGGTGGAATWTVVEDQTAP